MLHVIVPSRTILHEYQKEQIKQNIYLVYPNNYFSASLHPYVLAERQCHESRYWLPLHFGTFQLLCQLLKMI
jgi:hypothetical protein